MMLLWGYRKCTWNLVFFFLVCHPVVLEIGLWVNGCWGSLLTLTTDAGWPNRSSFWASSTRTLARWPSAAAGSTVWTRRNTWWRSRTCATRASSTRTRRCATSRAATRPSSSTPSCCGRPARKSSAAAPITEEKKTKQKKNATRPAPFFFPTLVLATASNSWTRVAIFFSFFILFYSFFFLRGGGSVSQESEEETVGVGGCVCVWVCPALSVLVCFFLYVAFELKTKPGGDTMGREIVLFLKFLWPTDKKRVNIGLRCPHASSRTRRPELETQGRGFEARPRFVDSSSSSGIPKTKKTNRNQSSPTNADVDCLEWSFIIDAFKLGQLMGLSLKLAASDWSAIRGQSKAVRRCLSSKEEAPGASDVFMKESDWFWRLRQWQVMSWWKSWTGVGKKKSAHKSERDVIRYRARWDLDERGMAWNWIAGTSAVGRRWSTIGTSPTSRLGPTGRTARVMRSSRRRSSPAQWAATTTTTTWKRTKKNRLFFWFWVSSRLKMRGNTPLQSGERGGWWPMPKLSAVALVRFDGCRVHRGTSLMPADAISELMETVIYLDWIFYLPKKIVSIHSFMDALKKRWRSLFLLLFFSGNGDLAGRGQPAKGETKTVAIVFCSVVVRWFPLVGHVGSERGDWRRCCCRSQSAMRFPKYGRTGFARRR